MNWSISYPRSALIGYNDFFHDLEEMERSDRYPPHNVIKVSDDSYQVQLAVAGFTATDIKVTVENRQLLITGDKEVKADHEYVHRGISSKKFRKVFILHEHVVVGTANLQDGILTVDLQIVVPESMKPKEIPILYPNDKVLLTED
jgi:molecular chaperone IbpA